jgi:hypothetical protein
LSGRSIRSTHQHVDDHIVERVERVVAGSGASFCFRSLLRDLRHGPGDISECPISPLATGGRHRDGFPSARFPLVRRRLHECQGLSAPEKATTDSQPGNYSDGKLDADRQRRLEELPGWTWKPPPRPKRRSRRRLGSGHRLLSGSYDATVQVWNPDTGQLIMPPLTGHAGAVFSVAISPDGHRVASGGDDNTVRLWDADTGRPIGSPLTGHTSFVTTVAFSPDGHRLASGSEDYTIRFWPAQPMPQLVCDKLTANMSHKQWRDWVSPDID